MTNYDRIISMNIKDIKGYMNKIKTSIFNTRTGENYKQNENVDIVDYITWLNEEEING